MVPLAKQSVLFRSELTGNTERVDLTQMSATTITLSGALPFTTSRGGFRASKGPGSKPGLVGAVVLDCSAPNYPGLLGGVLAVDLIGGGVQARAGPRPVVKKQSTSPTLRHSGTKGLGSGMHLRSKNAYWYLGENCVATFMSLFPASVACTVPPRTIAFAVYAFPYTASFPSPSASIEALPSEAPANKPLFARE